MIQHKLSIFFLLLALFGTAFTGPVTAQEEERYVSVRLIPERTEIMPGESFYVGIEQTIHPGWHTYWKNPGDSGAAPYITWDMPEGFAAGEVEYPVPHRIDIGGLTNYGYEGKVTLLQMITAPDPLPEGPVTLSVDIEILVCADICIPEFGTYSFTINSGTEQGDMQTVNEAFNHLPLDVDWDNSYKVENGRFILTLALEHTGMIGAQGGYVKFDLWPYEWGVIENSAQPVIGKRPPNVITIAKARGDRPLENLGEFEVLVPFSSETVQSALRLTAHPDEQWLAAVQSRKVEEQAQAGKTGEEASPVQNVPSADTDLWQAVLWAVLGGLILNLMPCVFPVLSMKALSLCRIKEKSLGMARMQGLAYTAGVLASFALIASILIALKAAGAQIGWGFQLQSPVIILLLAYLFFAIGLNLSGFYEIRGFSTGAGAGLASRGGLSGSFFTGILATIVATPCTAPFMGVAMGFALTQPPAASIGVFLALGFGLALPYLLLSFIPPLQKILPKPGPWMQVFRELLAFPMYLSVVWLVWVYSQQIGPIGAFYALSGLVALGFAVWMFHVTAAGKNHHPLLRGFAVLVLLTVAGATIYESRTPQPGENRAGGEELSGFTRPFTETAFEEALAGSAPVFVNMTADWCLTCKVNERVALKGQAVEDLFTVHKVIYFLGDWTNQNPEITHFLSRFGRNGVPLYVYYGPRDEKTGLRPKPVVLPQLLTPGLIKNMIKGDNS